MAVGPLQHRTGGGEKGALRQRTGAAALHEKDGRGHVAGLRALDVAHQLWIARGERDGRPTVRCEATKEPGLRRKSPP